ncbi:MAG TPA: CopG family transcriptional regulator [Rhizomicrobium sp.]
MKPDKIRHCLYFESKVSEQLEALTAEPGTTKSEIVNSALANYLKERGAGALESKFKSRLDRMDDRLGRIERNVLIGLESLALFIRYELSVTPPLPASQLAASQAAGNDRFQTFADQVSRRLAKGKAFADDIGARMPSRTDTTTSRKTH